jgi:hypothetical protein
VYVCVNSADRQTAGVALTTQRWEQSLADLQNPGSDDSLIPMFEGMVDRAFSKTPTDWAPGHDHHTLTPAIPTYSRNAANRDISSIA